MEIDQEELHQVSNQEMNKRLRNKTTSELLAELAKKQLSHSIERRCEDRFASSQTDAAGEVNVELLAGVSVELLKELEFVKLKVAPCFPPSYDVLSLYFQIYTERIFRFLSPFVMHLQEQEAVQNPATVLALIEVIDAYESVANNVLQIQVEEEARFLQLSGIVKQYTPCFLEHTDSLLGKWVLQMREEENNNIALLRQQLKDSKRKDKKSIEKYTSLPTLLFKLMEEQLETISQKLSNENLFELVKLMLQRVEKLVIEQIQETQKLRDPQDLLVLCVRVNNFHRMALLLRQFQGQALAFVTRSVSNVNALAHIRYRAETILTEKFRALNLSVNKAIEILALFIFKDVNDAEDPQSSIPALFRTEWFKPTQQGPSVMEEAYDTFSDYLKFVSKLVAKDIHISQVIYYLITYLTQAYFQALLLELNEGLKLKLPVEKCIRFTVASKLISGKKRSNIHASVDKKKDGSVAAVFNPTEYLAEGIEADLDSLHTFKEREEKKLMSAGAFYSKVKLKYMSVLELLTCSKSEVGLRVVDFGDAFRLDQGTKQEKQRAKRLQNSLLIAVLCKNQEVLGYFEGNEEKRRKFAEDFIQDEGNESKS